MRTSKTVIVLSTLLLTLYFISCVASDPGDLYIETSASREFKEADEIIVLTGRVKDEQGLPVPNGEISIQVNDSFNSSVHVSFTYSDVNGTFSDVVNLGPRPALGNYSIYITANKPGYQLGFAELKFSVTPKHFEIDASPQVKNVLGGEDAVYNIFISSVGRVDLPIFISITGMPNESSYFLSSNSVTSPANVTLTIKTNPETPAGSYNITVSGASAIGTRITHVTLTVETEQEVPPSYIYIYILAAAGCGILVFGFYRRRKGKRVIMEAPEKKPDKMYYVEGLPLPPEVLISLPDHLRKTAMILCHMDEATAQELAEKTGRARAVESSYLNQLVSMGHVKKRRSGRRVFFYVER